MFTRNISRKIFVSQFPALIKTFLPCERILIYCSCERHDYIFQLHTGNLRDKFYINTSQLTHRYYKSVLRTICTDSCRSFISSKYVLIVKGKIHTGYFFNTAFFPLCFYLFCYTVFENIPVFRFEILKILHIQFQLIFRNITVNHIQHAALVLITQIQFHASAAGVNQISTACKKYLYSVTNLCPYAVFRTVVMFKEKTYNVKQIICHNTVIAYLHGKNIRIHAYLTFKYLF